MSALSSLEGTRLDLVVGHSVLGSQQHCAHTAVYARWGCVHTVCGGKRCIGNILAWSTEIHAQRYYGACWVWLFQDVKLKGWTDIMCFWFGEGILINVFEVLQKLGFTAGSVTLVQSFSYHPEDNITRLNCWYTSILWVLRAYAVVKSCFQTSKVGHQHTYWHCESTQDTAVCSKTFMITQER